MLKISKESVLITKRFFIAIDVLIAQRKLRSLNSFARKYDINYWNLCTLRKEPEKRLLKVEFIYYLVRHFSVSPYYILTGVGNIVSE